MPYRIRRKASAPPKYAFLLVGLVSLVALFPAATEAQGLSHVEMTLGADYRRAQLDWNIAGDINGTSPNSLSELIWRDLEIKQVSAALQANWGDHVVVLGSGAYGETMNGNNQDSDYLGDYRSYEFSRSDNKGSGNIKDVSLALGYRVRLFDASVGHYVQVIPLLGYSTHRQNLRMKDGTQVIPTYAAGPIPGLDSTYDAEWKGPWVGLNLRSEVSAHTLILINLEYHRADYAAEANWNLRDDLAHPVSFRHDTKGSGIVTAVAFTHRLSRHWDFMARLESQHWTGNPGVDTTYDTSSGSVQAETTRLNVVHWRSRVVGVAAIFHF